MTEPATDDIALRWLASNLAWSLRLREHREAGRGACVLVQFGAIDEPAHDRSRRDRVA